MEKNNNKKLKVAVIREELVELTGDPIAALILNQAVFAHNATETMDENTQEAINNMISSGFLDMAKEMEKTILREGWFYKSPNSFYKEIMISSRSTVNRRIDLLVKKGWLIKGGQYFKQHKDKKGDIIQDSWWKVNIPKLRRDLFLIGYSLHNYPIWSPEEEQKVVHHEQGGVHHEHQHRLLHRELIENNKETSNIYDDDEKGFQIDFFAFKEFENHFKEKYQWDERMINSIYFQMQKQRLNYFTIKEAETQVTRMEELGEEKISSFPSYFVGGIILNRKSLNGAIEKNKNEGLVNEFKNKLMMD